MGSQVKVMAVYDDYEVDITDYVLFTSGDRNIAYVDEYYGNKYIKAEQRKEQLDNASYEGKKDTCTVKVDMAYEVEEMLSSSEKKQISWFRRLTGYRRY